MPGGVRWVCSTPRAQGRTYKEAQQHDGQRRVKDFSCACHLSLEGPEIPGHLFSFFSRYLEDFFFKLKRLLCNYKT